MEEWFLRAVARHQSVGQENGVIAKMRPQFIRCDFLAGESVMTYDVLDWELNPQNMIHGGITSTGFDTSLGMLAHYYAYPYVLTTVNLSVSFLRPIRLGDGMVYHSKIKSFGRSLVTLTVKCICAAMANWQPLQQVHSKSCMRKKFPIKSHKICRKNKKQKKIIIDMIERTEHYDSINRRNFFTGIYDLMFVTSGKHRILYGARQCTQFVAAASGIL